MLSETSRKSTVDFNKFSLDSKRPEKISKEHLSAKDTVLPQNYTNKLSFPKPKNSITISITTTINPTNEPIKLSHKYSDASSSVKAALKTDNIKDLIINSALIESDKHMKKIESAGLFPASINRLRKDSMYEVNLHKK